MFGNSENVLIRTLLFAQIESYRAILAWLFREVDPIAWTTFV